MARRRRSRKRSTARRSVRRRVVGAARVARRRRSKAYATIKRHQPGGGTSGRLVRVRRRVYRRNPSLVKTIVRGLTDAALVTGGKVASNIVTKQIATFNLPLPGQAGDLIKSLGVAFAVSWGASKFIGSDKARMITAGAYQALVEGLIKAANIPMVSEALGEYDVLRNNYSGLGTYARPMALGAYPGAGTFEGASEYQQQM